MITYKDKTFCSFNLLCKNPCDRALTPEVMEDATKWAKEIGIYPDVTICQFGEFPECFKPVFDSQTENPLTETVKQI